MSRLSPKSYVVRTTHSIRQHKYLEAKVGAVASIVSNTRVLPFNNSGYPGVRWQATFPDYHVGEELYAWLYAFKNTPGKTRKYVTRKTLEHLTPEAWAYWFQDDGSMTIKKKNGSYKGRHFNLSTHNFTFQENELIASVMGENFGMNVHVHRQRQYPILYWNSTEMQKFESVIRPFIVPSMLYKLDHTIPRLSESNKAMSALEKEIVQPAA